MSVVKVYRDGKEFDVENTAKLSRAMITQVGGAQHTVIFFEAGYDMNENTAVGERGIVKGKVQLSSIGGMRDMQQNMGLQGVFDERKANNANFANLLHKHLLNLTFKHFLDIEPIDVSDGSVVAPYDTP